MPESPNRVVVDRVDWLSVLPVLRLASAFKHALQPGKLVVALLAVLAIHVSGTLLDAVWAAGDQPAIYNEILEGYTAMAGALMHGSLSMHFSLDEADGVPNILGRMTLWFPAVMIQNHPWFVLIFGTIVLAVLALASGTLCRMAASQVCADQPTSLTQAACRVRQRWTWYLLTPLMPVMLILVVGVLLALAGLVFFNIPFLDIVGSAIYGLLLMLGFVIAIVCLLLLFALFLMPPALSVEGSDGFDAIARSFNYILFRPWQFAAFLVSAIIYLAVVYVIVSTVASLTLNATAYFVELGSLVSAGASEFDERSRFEAIVTDNAPGDVMGVSAWLVARWSEFVHAVVLAIVLSTFCCLQTQVYVLLRRSADGTPTDQYDPIQQTSVASGVNASTDSAPTPPTEPGESPATQTTDEPAKPEG